MEVVRWIFYIPVVIITQVISSVVLEFLLRIIFKLGYYIIFWGSRYYMPPMTTLGATIEDVKTFIFTTCLALVGSGVVAGMIGKMIIPNTGREIAYIILLIVLLLWYAVNCTFFWMHSNPAWWVGVIAIITYLISYILLISLSYED